MFIMSKINFSAAMLLVIFVGCISFSTGLSAYTINGSVVTLTASDRTTDNTALIQGFLNNATYTKIIIQPGTNNASWPVRPLFFNHSATEIHLNASTILEAKSGGFPNGSDCLLKATSLSDIKVTGDAGSKILMHKEEYALLAAAEWRHGLSFLSCDNITISGLILENTGGDGIYLGGVTGGDYCSDVIMTNVVIDVAGRNGVSVISVDGVTITGCTFKNTHGQGNVAASGPWAGIDLEPNNSSQRLRNIVIDGCSFSNNAGSGWVVWAPNLDGSSEIVNIITKNCTMTGNTANGVVVSCVPASLSDISSIVFENCTISDNKDAGVWVDSKSQDAGRLSFANCSLNNNNVATSNTAFLINNSSIHNTAGGNIQLNNIVVAQPTNRTVSYFLGIDGAYGSMNNVSGSIYASGGLLSVENTTNLDLTTASNAVPSCPSTAQLQHHWKLDETSGSNTAYDSIGACNGTLYNSPAWVTGRIGGGLALNGTSQFVTVPNDPSLNIGIGDFSISLWMQRNDDPAGNKRLLYKGAGSATDIGYCIAGSNTYLQLLISNGVTRLPLTCTIPSLNQWHHYVFTINRSSGKVKSYLNGVYQAELDISNFGNISNTKNLLIGALDSAGSLAWPGKIDDIRIYGRILAASEIAYLVADASAYWKLDDGAGYGASDCIGRSAGVLQNNPTWITGKFGCALELNGINQFVSVSNNSSDLNIGTGDFSISLWMQRNDDPAGNKRLLYKGASSATDIGYCIAGSNTYLQLLISNGVTRLPLTCTIPSLNQWHHYVFTINRSSGKVKSYLNGGYQSSTDVGAFSGVDISNTADLLIGAANNSGWLAWPGEVDDVRIYKRVLSAEEVVQLFSATP